MNLGEKIKYVRTSKKLSLNKLSKECELSITYLSEIERSVKNPSLKSLEKIAKVLNLDTSYFLGNVELILENSYRLPDDVKEFVDKPDTLSHILLAKKLYEDGINPDYIIGFLELIKQIKT